MRRTEVLSSVVRTRRSSTSSRCLSGRAPREALPGTRREVAPALRHAAVRDLQDRSSRVAGRCYGRGRGGDVRRSRALGRFRSGPRSVFERARPRRAMSYGFSVNHTGSGCCGSRPSPESPLRSLGVARQFEQPKSRRVRTPALLCPHRRPPPPPLASDPLRRVRADFGVERAARARERRPARSDAAQRGRTYGWVRNALPIMLEAYREYGPVFTSRIMQQPPWSLMVVQGVTQRGRRGRVSRSRSRTAPKAMRPGSAMGNATARRSPDLHAQLPTLRTKAP
jgi:hypothetical protein